MFLQLILFALVAVALAVPQEAVLRSSESQLNADGSYKFRQVELFSAISISYFCATRGNKKKKIMISMHYLMNVFRFSIVKQLRDWWWHTSGWKWWAEASYCRRLRNCFQRTIHICLRRCTIHHRLGCRWKWICCHRWSLAQSSLNCR